MWEAFRKGATQYGACDFNYAVDQSELEKMVLFFFYNSGSSFYSKVTGEHAPSFYGHHVSCETPQGTLVCVVR